MLSLARLVGSCGRVVAGAAALAVVVALATAPAEAQTCPTHYPYASYITFVGTNCATNSYTPCALGQAVTFTAQSYYGYAPQSCDTYAWDFGDGTLDTFTGVSTASHIYTTAGAYTVRIRISDSLGSSTAYYYLAAANGYFNFSDTPYSYP